MSELLNKKYNIELEVLTPLHIGAGAEKDLMRGSDYISDKGKVYVLNHKKVLKNLGGDANDFSNFLLSKNDKGLKAKISGNLESVSDIIFESPTGSENDIKAFIKNGLTSKPIVPGSSLKGAIRSILFSYLKEKHQNDEKQVFGSANDGDEFMRFIKISDAQFQKSELINTKIFNLFGTAPNLSGGWKHEFRGGTNKTFKVNGFNTIYEIIKSNEKGDLSIALSDKAFDNYYHGDKPKKKSDILHDTLSNQLFKIINEHAKKYIQKQIDFFDKYSNDETDAIINSLKRIITLIPSDNSSCVLQMSAGSGFHSITGDWQFDDFSINRINSSGRGPSRGQFNSNDSAKSRKIATDGNTFDLMGFVKLSILTEEVIAQREIERKTKLEADRIAEEERFAIEKAELDRIDAEKQAIIDAKMQAEAEYIAREKAEADRIEKILKDNADEEKSRQEANKAKKEELINSGLSSIADIDDFNKGKSIIKSYRKLNRTINSDQFEHIKLFIQSCINKDIKKWKSIKRDNWKEVRSWVGQETAQNWYTQLKN